MPIATSLRRPALRWGLAGARVVALAAAIGLQAARAETPTPAPLPGTGMQMSVPAHMESIAPLAASAPPAEDIGRADLPHDLSPAGMFLHADRVVQAVMAGLGLASLATWIIWLAKTVELAAARRRSRRVLGAVSGATTLAEAGSRAGQGAGPAALMLAAAAEETTLSTPALAKAGPAGVKERVASALDQIERHAARRMRRGTGILATIGSTAPFVGLFGTVWGIMNAFIGISQAQTTNLAVVAPGIAEALMATAAGLVAAIPAVVIYNIFARAVASYRQDLGDIGAGIERLVSRDLDFRDRAARPGDS